MLLFHILGNIEWVALAIMAVATLNWVLKGPGAQYTAAWWALCVLLGIMALYREAQLASALGA